MANASISQIKVGNITYDVCDATARDSLQMIKIVPSTMRLSSKEFTFNNSKRYSTTEFIEITNNSSSTCFFWFLSQHHIKQVQADMWIGGGTYKWMVEPIVNSFGNQRIFMDQDEENGTIRYENSFQDWITTQANNYNRMYQNTNFEWISSDNSTGWGGAIASNSASSATCRFSIVLPHIIGFHINSVTYNGSNPITAGGTNDFKVVSVEVN